MSSNNGGTLSNNNRTGDVRGINLQGSGTGTSNSTTT